MISLEMAKKLKEAGLEWEPKFGDHYIIPAVFEEGLHGVMDTKQIMSYHKNPKEWEESIRGFVFTPRLDQLLAEIEEWGYAPTLVRGGSDEEPEYFLELQYWEAQYRSWEDMHEQWSGNTREEASASALLWILEGRTDHD